MGRIFVVRVNLDAMGAELDTLYTAEQKADWMTGFRSGSRGSVAPESAPDALLMGNCFGLGCHAEAANFSAQRSTAGKASAQRRANICSTAGQHMFNGKPNGEVNQPSAFSLQPLSNQPTANIPPVCLSVSIGPTPDQLDICQPYPPGDVRVYPKARSAKVGLPEWIVHHPRCILGKDRDLWQGLFDYAGHETMSHAYERIAGDAKLWFSTFNDYIHANYEEDKSHAAQV